MNKELELEAEQYARRFEENEQSGYNGESLSIEDRMEIEAFISGATSKYVEKQKLEFAIEQLNALGQVHDETLMSERVKKAIRDLEQKLSEL